MSKIQRGKPKAEVSRTKARRHPISLADDAEAIETYIEDNVKNMKDVKEILKILAIRSLGK